MQAKLLGSITRAPKGLGWHPSYPAAWQELVPGSTWEAYQQVIAREIGLLTQDYIKQEENLAYWPEVHFELDSIQKSKSRQELKRWLKQIAFINHLGPYKGWLFPTKFGDQLEVVVAGGYRAAYLEKPNGQFDSSLIAAAVTDKSLAEILQSEGMIVDGKSSVYTYKVNTGSVVLPGDLESELETYAASLSDKLSFAPKAAFTIDFMLSPLGIHPIEVHGTPLGIVHDFRETGLEDKTQEFIQQLVQSYPNVAILTNSECLENGFYSTEIANLVELMSSYGGDAIVTQSLDEVPHGWYVMPYKAESSSSDHLSSFPQETFHLLENKLEVNKLLQECEAGCISKPAFSIVTCPDFYVPGSTFIRPGHFSADHENYHLWKLGNQFPDWVVIKPLDHHGWSPQILYLPDLSDAAVLFSHTKKYGPIIVENMVSGNLVLGNGEIRAFFQVV